MNIKEIYKKAFDQELSRSEKKIIASDAEYSVLYAKNIIKGPFVEGEESIKRNISCAYFYCKDVIKQRWYEVEEEIKKDAFCAYSYATQVIKDRWPEAEKSIKKNPKWACAYAIDAMKERWKEAESVIAKNQYAAQDYYNLIIKGNWKDWSEDEIARSTVWMYYYALSIGDMLPKKLHEKMLCHRKDDFYFEYIDFLKGKM